MGSTYAAGKKAIAVCDRCGMQVLLKTLKYQTLKQQPTSLLVCPECLDIDHPQLMLGTFPVYDPQALEDPRRDNSYFSSRDIQWGWNPVGMPIMSGVPNTLVAYGEVGNVTVNTV